MGRRPSVDTTWLVSTTDLADDDLRTCRDCGRRFGSCHLVGCSVVAAQISNSGPDGQVRAQPEVSPLGPGSYGDAPPTTDELKRLIIEAVDPLFEGES